MADYREIDSHETKPNAPVTSELMIALADNSTAIAEGATDAPRIVRGALKTATNSVTVTIPLLGLATITLDPTSFFPSITSTGPSDIRVRPRTSGDADTPGFVLENVSETTARDVTVYWRYMAAL
jgi:hypothetical protein